MVEPTQPTNSIDSELEEILDESLREILNNICWREMLTIEEFDQAIAKIKALYRKEIEEAIGEDDDPFYEMSNTNAIVATRLNDFRKELRAKLLPPTKGGNDE